MISVLENGYLWVIHALSTSLHKNTWVASDQDGVEVMSMIDLALVKKDMLYEVQDMRAVRGTGWPLRSSCYLQS